MGVKSPCLSSEGRGGEEGGRSFVRRVGSLGGACPEKMGFGRAPFPPFFSFLFQMQVLRKSCLSQSPPLPPLSPPPPPPRLLTDGATAASQLWRCSSVARAAGAWTPLSCLALPPHPCVSSQSGESGSRMTSQAGLWRSDFGADGNASVLIGRRSIREGGYVKKKRGGVVCASHQLQQRRLPRGGMGCAFSISRSVS